MNNLLSISQISKEINIPESTIRYYRDKFPEFFHGVGSGKRKKYYPDVAEKILTISQLMTDNVATCEIIETLKSKYTAVLDVVAEKPTTISQPDVIVLISAMGELLKSQNEMIERNNEKIDMLIAEVRNSQKRKWFWQK